MAKRRAVVDSESDSDYEPKLAFKTVKKRPSKPSLKTAPAESDFEPEPIPTPSDPTSKAKESLDDVEYCPSEDEEDVEIQALPEQDIDADTSDPVLIYEYLKKTSIPEQATSTSDATLIFYDVKKRSNPAYWALVTLYCTAFYALTQSTTAKPQWGVGGLLTLKMHHFISSWPSVDHAVMVIMGHLPRHFQDILANTDSLKKKLAALWKLPIFAAPDGPGVYLALCFNKLLNLFADYVGSSLISIFARMKSHTYNLRSGERELGLYRLLFDEVGWEMRGFHILEFKHPYDSSYWVLFTENSHHASFGCLRLRS